MSDTPEPELDSPPRRPDDQGSRPSGTRRLTFRAAGRAGEFFDHLQAHYRECRRKDADVEADVRIVLVGGDSDGAEFDRGTARVKNVSPTGALLVDVKLSKGAYPAAEFRLELTMRSGGYQGIGFRATPVRFVTAERGIGVKFDEIFIARDAEGGGQAKGAVEGEGAASESADEQSKD